MSSTTGNQSYQSSPLSSASIMDNNGGQSVPKSIVNAPMFDRIRYKTEMCKNYAEIGVCKFNDRCFYAHSAEELRPLVHKHKKHKTQLCKPFHTDGYCDFGSRCAFIHSKPDVPSIVRRLNRFVESVRYRTDNYRSDGESDDNRNTNRLSPDQLDLFFSFN